MNDAADRAAIREVLAWYMRAMRLRDVDLMDAVFTADATIDYTAIGGSVASWPDTKPWLRGMIDVELFMLFVGDVYPVFGADRADRRGREHVARRVRRLGRRPPLIVFGTYDDRFVRTPDGWRISERIDHPAVQVPAGSAPE